MGPPSLIGRSPGIPCEVGLGAGEEPVRDQAAEGAHRATDLQADAFHRQAAAAEVPLVQDAAPVLPERAELLVTDLIDHRCAVLS